MFYAGDILQPAPMIDPTGYTHFRDQVPVSLFSRLLSTGADAVWFNYQHRYNSTIASVVNACLPDTQIRTDPAADQREETKRFKTVMKNAFNVNSSVAFFSVDGEAQINTYTKSSFNIRHAQSVFAIVLRLLEYGIPAQDLGLAVPYTAQLNLYSTARHAMENYCRTGPEHKHRKYANAVRDLNIFTVDSIQGGQVQYLILDTVVAGSLQFMSDTARWLMAITRPQSGLLIVGSVRKVTSYYSDKMHALRSTAYYKTVQWCRENRVYIDTQTTKNAVVFGDMTAPFKVDDDLERIFTRQLDTDGPMDFSVEPDFAFNPAPSSDQGDEDGGVPMDGTYPGSKIANSAEGGEALDAMDISGGREDEARDDCSSNGGGEYESGAASVGQDGGEDWDESQHTENANTQW